MRYNDAGVVWVSVRLSPDEIQAGLADLPGWVRAGNEIRREFEFPDFATAVAFVNRVAAAAERADHHPDIDIRFNHVTLVLSTHSAGGLTRRDFDLAAVANRLAAA